jgi:lipid-binding SYLF domain-containing protein
MKARIATAMLVAGVFGMAFGCSDYRDNGQPASTSVTTQDQAVAQRFQERDPSMTRFFNTAYAYAIFPRIEKGAVGIGGAHGDGMIYQNGRLIGYVTMSQATIGAQLGGEAYSEVIFFQSRPVLDQFQAGEFALAAQASAVAASNGAATNADYERGVAVFTLPESGLMFEASVGGQKFTCRPLGQ